MRDYTVENILKFDLEHTRQWAIAAEKELYEMKKRALKAEALVKTLEITVLQAKIEEMGKAIKELNSDVEYWHTSHTNVAADLADAKGMIDEGNRIIEEITQERDALYASLS